MIFIIISSCTYRPCLQFSSVSGGFGYPYSGFWWPKILKFHFYIGYRIKQMTIYFLLSIQTPGSPAALQNIKISQFFKFFVVYIYLPWSGFHRRYWIGIFSGSGSETLEIKDNNETETKRSLDVLKTEAKRLRLWSDVYEIEAMMLSLRAMSMK